MSDIIGFLPVASEDAKVLILGSMPGVKSLNEKQYYAHGQNGFWGIIEVLFGINRSYGYEQRLTLLCEYRIALWDVMKACRRHGSLDADIEANSIVANGFEIFFKEHPDITHVFFNGSKAEQAYKKYVLNDLPEKFSGIQYLRLPSTSPAHAVMPFDQKLKQWEVVKDCLDG